jgi:hypothetical protein
MNMAMNGNDMGDEIYAAIQVAVAAMSDEHNASIDEQKSILRAMATAIVTHIQSNAQATGVDVPAGNTHDLSIS